MATLNEMMDSVVALRDAIYDRIDDNVSDDAFRALRLRHLQAIVQARRILQQPPMAPNSPQYGPIVTKLDAAKDALAAADESNEAAILAACRLAENALNAVRNQP